MKTSALFLAIGATFGAHGWYAMAAVSFAVAVVVLVAQLPPSRCTQNCRQGRDCTCGDEGRS